MSVSWMNSSGLAAFSRKWYTGSAAANMSDSISSKAMILLCE
ncbi:MAG: hypothetical protein P4M11_04145 [Candidatus Pacebacteria bacterium]|nr:hypothetical protein [Candidatus Paceibacterota bacterium]